MTLQRKIRYFCNNHINNDYQLDTSLSNIEFIALSYL